MVLVFFFLSCFFFLNQIKNSLFVLWVNLCMITGIYLHGPPPFNGPFFMTPPFSASKSCGPPSVSTFPTPPANFCPYKNFDYRAASAKNSWLHAARLSFFNLLQRKCTHKNQKVSVQENVCKSKDEQILSDTDRSVVYTAPENTGKSGIARLKTTVW